MSDNNNYFNTIFYSLLVFTLIIVCFIGYKAHQQNSFYQQTQSQFYQAIEVSKQNNDQVALGMVKGIIPYYPDSYEVATIYAQMLFNNDKYAEAVKYMDKAEKIYPAIILNEKFLFEHSRVLIGNGQYGDARLYLQQIGGSDPDLHASAQQLLFEINELESKAGNRR